MGKAMIELRIWLDHNRCVPIDFEIARIDRGMLWVRIEFADDGHAKAFESEFGR